MKKNQENSLVSWDASDTVIDAITDAVKAVLSNVNNLRSHRILSHDYALYLKWEIPVIESMSYVYPFKHLFIQDHSYK